MKIQRFNENNGNRTLYYIFSDVIDEGYGEHSISSALYDNEEDALNFLIKRLYTEYKEKDLNLEDLDNCDTVDELMAEYNEMLSNQDMKSENGFYCDQVWLNSFDNEVDDWIKVRRNSKKYNV